MDFDKYFKANFKDLHEAVCCGDLVAVNYKKAIKKGFKAGQQSKQAEIDALKAKLDDLAKWAEFHIEDYNLSESESEHDRGWFNAACQVFKTLKENNNDT